jgi:hypothetical protein
MLSFPLASARAGPARRHSGILTRGMPDVNSPGARSLVSRFRTFVSRWRGLPRVADQITTETRREHGEE